MGDVAVVAIVGTAEESMGASINVIVGRKVGSVVGVMVGDTVGIVVEIRVGGLMGDGSTTGEVVVVVAVVGVDTTTGGEAGSVSLNDTVGLLLPLLLEYGFP
jgi:hypothetical protein